ncbi:MAG: helix-turn-helix domain-containing protein [Oligoflexia bacterium]
MRDSITLTDSEIQSIADRIAKALGASFGSFQADGLLDIYGAAELLGCSVSTLERRTKEGSIPSVKFGRLRRYRRADLLAMQTKKGGADE